uniref:Uncharacterized protein n=1 Tax=Anguilla anguilla TaxID=7936 RepID=A0A0E9XHM3_ANGAN
MNGIRRVGSAVEGAIPKQTMDMRPRPAVNRTLLWSRTTDFRNSRNSSQICN